MFMCTMFLLLPSLGFFIVSVRLRLFKVSFSLSSELMCAHTIYIVYMLMCVCVCVVVESRWRWCDTLWHCRTSRNPTVFTVWLPGNTGPCWKKPTNRKSHASVPHGCHAALPIPLFERLKVPASKCVTELFMSLPPREVQCVRRVTTQPVSVIICMCANTEPRAAYVYVRVTATHRYTQSERCVCLWLHSSCFVFQRRKNMRDTLHFCFRNGKDRGKKVKHLVWIPSDYKTAELCLVLLLLLYPLPIFRGYFFFLVLTRSTAQTINNVDADLWFGKLEIKLIWLGLTVRERLLFMFY